jgi:hypothetical protein
MMETRSSHPLLDAYHTTVLVQYTFSAINDSPYQDMPDDAFPYNFALTPPFKEQEGPDILD